MRKVAVIGLGRFGMVLARKLAASGAQVIAIDRSDKLVNEIKDDVAVAVRLDSTDEAALASQGIDSVDVAVVSIGENFEAAVLTTMIVRKLGVSRIVCRAQTVTHGEIFRRIGADEVIQPEKQAGEQLARRLATPHLQDFISLAEGFTLIELFAPSAFQGRTLKSLELRTRYGVNLVAIKRVNIRERDGIREEIPEIVSVPQPENVILPKDVLVLVGSDQDLAKLPRE